MPRFFVKKDAISDGRIEIVGQDAFHIARSLRMAVGDGLTVCDGEGLEYFVKLTHIRDERCECEIIKEKKSDAELPFPVTLFMAYPKGDKLETVIQKAVELGAVKIVPFESSRCIKRPKAEKQEKQLARLSKIAEEAAKQSGRAELPEVSPALSFDGMLKEAKKCGSVLFCYEGEEELSLKSALDAINPGDGIAVVVGSEGGFSPEEAALAKESGALSVTLGKRILRCETAPLFVLASIAYRFEL